jgi:methyl-accepting chemotaxis protein
MNSQEYVLTENDLIVSHTDLKGIITFVNEDLARISGYSRDELLGKSHNIFRHPDMPSEVFSDLWKTISQEQTWSGLVKNKTKDGGFYWVRANITPIYDDDKLIGYMSVRCKNNFDNVKKIISIYADIKAGIFKGTVVGGQILENDKVSQLKRAFSNVTIKNKFISLTFLMAFSLIVSNSVGYLSLKTDDDNFDSTMRDFKHYSSMIELGSEARADLKSSMQEWKNILLRGQNLSDFEKYNTAFESDYQKTTEDLEQLKQKASFLGVPNTQVDNLLKQHQENLVKYRTTLKNYQHNDTSMHLVDSMVKDIDRNEAESLNALIKSLENNLDSYIRNSENVSHALMNQNKLYSSLILCFVFSVTCFLFWLTLSDITKPLNYAIATLKQIANGNYLVPIDNLWRNELGGMLNMMQTMSIRLGVIMDMEKRYENDRLAVQIGLDNVSTGVLIIDNNRKIIYKNRSANALLHETQNYIRQDLPNFNADQIVGQNIDVFHKNPKHQIDLLEKLVETTTIETIIGGRHIKLKVSPIISKFGHRVGTVAEWDDLTDSVNIENQISLIVENAINGRFNDRFNPENKKGFYKKLTEQLNQLLEICETGFSDFQRVFSSMVQGNLTEKIERHYKGDFDVLTQDANLAVLQLNTIVYDLTKAIETINLSMREITEGNSNLANRTQTQTENLEQTVNAISELKIAVQQNDEAAKYANDSVNRVSDVVNRGVKIIKNVANTMENIHDSSLKVVDIIAVIDSIAFQTNILALNAAVEAARAGEQGKGFAVVATEVRSLAQRATTAASEIKHLITASEEKVEDGSQSVIDAGEIMQEISNSINNVTIMMSKIAQSCSEQSLTIEQVNSAIKETENIVKQNSDLVIKAASASTVLEEEIKSLSEKTDYFKVQKNVVDFQLF